MNTSLFKFIFASTMAFTGWHMGMDWLDSSSGKPFDPIKATQIRRSLLKIEWGRGSVFTLQYGLRREDEQLREERSTLQMTVSIQKPS